MFCAHSLQGLGCAMSEWEGSETILGHLAHVCVCVCGTARQQGWVCVHGAVAQQALLVLQGVPGLQGAAGGGCATVWVVSQRRGHLPGIFWGSLCGCCLCRPLQNEGRWMGTRCWWGHGDVVVVGYLVLVRTGLVGTELLLLGKEQREQHGAALRHPWQAKGWAPFCHKKPKFNEIPFAECTQG